MKSNPHAKPNVQNKTNKQMNKPKEHPQTKQSSVHSHAILTVCSQVYFVGAIFCRNYRFI